MLSVPSLSAMIFVIAVALLATVVLTGLAGVLLGRARTSVPAGRFTAQIPAQRRNSNSNSGSRKTAAAQH